MDSAERLNYQPAYDQKHFPLAARRGRWVVVAAPQGVDGALAIRQQATLALARLDAGEPLETALDPSKRHWLHVASGAVMLGERTLAAGDALGFVEASGSLHLQGVAAVSDLLWLTLPG